MRASDDPYLPVVIAARDRRDKRALLEIQIVLGDLQKIGARDRRNAKSLSGFQDHQAFRDQL
jgi:hypothetical protein